MLGLPRTAVDTLQEAGLEGLVEVLLIAVIIYTILRILRGTTAMSLLRGSAIILGSAWLLALGFRLDYITSLLQQSLSLLFVTAVVIFQPEIRRTLERVGRTRVPALRTRPAVDALIDALAGGCREIAAQGHGALMVIERDTGLEDYIATGCRVDAVVSADLLANIFFRNAPLHDGAVVIRGDRIAAASCTLPLGEAPSGGHVGTRHRAGIGISERTDAVSVIVSEETSEFSVASNGRLVSKLDDARLRALLATLLGQDGNSRTGRLAPGFGVRRLGHKAEHEVVS